VLESANAVARAIVLIFMSFPLRYAPWGNKRAAALSFRFLRRLR
jgi:hypothetical protein